MPFTAAHPAIILPFLKVRYVSATALVIGSTAPDFEYFFQMAVNSRHSHALAGIFYFDLPVTFLLGWLFHAIVKKNFIGNLPVFLQCRLQDTLYAKTSNILFKRGMVFAFSAVVGAASHIFWDGFTHNNTYFTNTLPFYRGTYIPYGGVRYPLFYALQHISSIVGLVVIAIYLLMRKPSSAPSLQKPRLMYWIALVLITTSTVWLRFTIQVSDLEIGNFVVSVVSGLCLAAILCGLINFRNLPFRSAGAHG